MKIKNNKLRVNKLNWSNESRLHKDLKFDNVEDKDFVLPSRTGANKQVVICPTCKKKFEVNNPSKIPDHKSNNWYQRTLSKVCQGSWSQQVNNQVVFEVLPKKQTHTPAGFVKLGQPCILSINDQIIETTIERINLVYFATNDGTKSNTYKFEIKFANVPLTFHAHELKPNILTIDRNWKK